MNVQPLLTIAEEVHAGVALSCVLNRFGPAFRVPNLAFETP